MRPCPSPSMRLIPCREQDRCCTLATLQMDKAPRASTNPSTAMPLAVHQSFLDTLHMAHHRKGCDTFLVSLTILAAARAPSGMPLRPNKVGLCAGAPYQLFPVGRLATAGELSPHPRPNRAGGGCHRERFLPFSIVAPSVPALWYTAAHRQDPWSDILPAAGRDAVSHSRQLLDSSLWGH